MLLKTPTPLCRLGDFLTAALRALHRQGGGKNAMELLGKEKGGASGLVGVLDGAGAKARGQSSISGGREGWCAFPVSRSTARRGVVGSNTVRDFN